MVADGEPCRKNSASGVPFTDVFVTGLTAESLIESKRNFNHKLLILKGLRNSHWTAVFQKYSHQSSPRRNGCSETVTINGASIHRQKKIHSVVADVDLPIARHLSPGSSADDPEGQVLMEQIPKRICHKKPLLMDKAYEGDNCRNKAKSCGMRPVVPPKSNRKEPWKYSKKLYKRRHIVERNFRNIKEFRRVFTRYDKLDETYNAFVSFASINRFLRNLV